MVNCLWRAFPKSQTAYLHNWLESQSMSQNAMLVLLASLLVWLCVCCMLCVCVCVCPVGTMRSSYKAFPDLSYFCFPHPAYWHGHHTQCSQDAQFWTDIQTGFSVHIVLLPHGQDGCLLFFDWLNKQRLGSHSLSLSLPTPLNCWMLSRSSSSVINRQSATWFFWLPVAAIQLKCWDIMISWMWNSFRKPSCQSVSVNSLWRQILGKPNRSFSANGVLFSLTSCSIQLNR